MNYAKAKLFMFEIISNNAQKTQEIAAHLAQEVLQVKPQNTSLQRAVIIGLVGELGAGKTTFIQGFASSLSVAEKVLSPTFLIIKKFELPSPEPMSKKSSLRYLYHIDGYRLTSPQELLDLHFKEIIEDPKNIVLVEWADKFKKILPPETIWINFEWLAAEKRKIVILPN